MRAILGQRYRHITRVCRHDLACAPELRVSSAAGSEMSLMFSVDCLANKNLTEPSGNGKRNEKRKDKALDGTDI